MPKSDPQRSHVAANLVELLGPGPAGDPDREEQAREIFRLYYGVNNIVSGVIQMLVNAEREAPGPERASVDALRRERRMEEEEARVLKVLEGRALPLSEVLRKVGNMPGSATIEAIRRLRSDKRVLCDVAIESPEGWRNNDSVYRINPFYLPEDVFADQ